MNEFKRDLAYAWRQLWRRKTFTAMVVATLAVGIGLNVAVFSAVSAMLLRPLPAVEDSANLVQLYRSYPGEKFGSLSVPDFFDLRQRTKDVFDGVTSWTFATVSLSANGTARAVMGHLVSADYFTVLGVKPQLGRGFRPEEDNGPMAHPVVVLSDGTWKQLFGGDPGIIGRQVVMNGRQMEIVGVAPPDFRGAMPMIRPAMWVPLMQMDQIRPGSIGALEARNSRAMNGLARLAEGVSVDQARARLKAVMSDLRAAYPDIYATTEINVVPQTEAGLHPSMRPTQVALSFVVMAVVSILLLIACVNVANLFLARARERSREIAVRLAMGSSRRRLVRQLLTESLLFSLVAGVAGLGVATAAMRLTDQITVPGIDFAPDLQLSPIVLAFSLGVTLGTAMLFGLLPAWQATRTSLVPALKGESAGGAPKARANRALVVAQMALSVVLLVSAGLFLVNLRSAEVLDKGFDAKNRLLASLNPGLQGYARPETEAFYQSLLERLRAKPAVKAAALMSVAPLSIGSADRGISVPGYVPRQGERMEVHFSQITPGYFEAMGVPLLKGRAFDDTDSAESMPAIIVNKKFADRFWPGQEPLGRIVRLGGKEPRDFTVVGVTPTGKYRTLGEAALPYMYLPHAQDFSPGMAIVIHANGAPEGVGSILRAEVRALSPDIPLIAVATMDEALGAALLPARISGFVLGALGAIGLLLASLGIYGVMAYSVSQRGREIGIRIALGAEPRAVAGLVMREGLGLVSMGAMIGLAGAFGASLLLRGVLYGASGNGVVFAVVPAVLLAVSALAIWTPARRAAGVDPLVTLRME